MILFSGGKEVFHLSNMITRVIERKIYISIIILHACRKYVYCIQIIIFYLYTLLLIKTKYQGKQKDKILTVYFFTKKIEIICVGIYINLSSIVFSFKVQAYYVLSNEFSFYTYQEFYDL